MFGSIVHSQQTQGQRVSHICAGTTCALLLVAANMAIAEHEHYWSPAGGGMEGVGSISKLWPASTYDLHWNAGSGPENAQFEIDLDNISDCDTCFWWSELDQQYYAHVAERGYSWLKDWKASAGTITTSGYYTTPAAVNNHITISCFVYDSSAEWVEGSVVANYYDTGNDSRVFREWGGHLQSFRVGVRMPADNSYYWENDPSGSKQFILRSNLSNLECSQVTTIGGTTDASSSGAGWSLTRTWVTITDPPGCNIQGGINYGPFIAANGMLEIYFMGYCTAPGITSSIGTLIEGIAGTLPLGNYKPAAASITHIFGSGNCDVVASIALKAVIQYVDDSGTFREEGPWSGAEPKLFMGSINVSCLNCSGSVCYKEGETTEGTVSATSRVAVHDDSPYQWAHGEVTEVPSADNYLVYGASRPSYSH